MRLPRVSDSWVVPPRPSNSLCHARPRTLFEHPHYPAYSDLDSCCRYLLGFFVQFLVRKCKEQKERREKEMF